MKRNTIDCSDFLSKELKIQIKHTRNRVSILTGRYYDSNSQVNKSRRNNSGRN
jgi:hypothetical protein